MRGFVLWLPFVLILSACHGAHSQATRSAGGGATPTVDLSGVLSVAQAVSIVDAATQGAAPASLSLHAYVNQPPTQGDSAVAPPANCPVVAARLPTLTDESFPTSFRVAGVDLPNALPAGMPALDLVIPFSLGMIDLPQQAEFHGHVFDPAYASCPNAGHLFVLDSIEHPVPMPTAQATSNDQLTASWQVWSDPVAGFALNYPDGWGVQVTHNVGSVVTAEFASADAARHISLNVVAGETFWSQESPDAAPAPLQGDRQLLTSAGQALARLVDVVGDPTGTGRQRTVRLVFNYAGNTVIVSTRFVDGADLDSTLLGIFTGMTSSFRFDKPLAISDPMDPTLTANDSIGAGPFIGQSTAIEFATASSGLTQVNVVDATMVSEKAARETTPGVCREFQQRPEAVWLVKMTGTKATGESVTRLVYLDAVTGDGICQTDLNTGG